MRETAPIDDQKGARGIDHQCKKKPSGPLMIKKERGMFMINASASMRGTDSDSSAEREIH